MLRLSLPYLIIGAGAAGLAAAEILLDAEVDFIILEASPQAGGRVRSHVNTHFCDFPLELGAEEIHGPDNLVHNLAIAQGHHVLQHYTTDDLIRLDGRLQLLDQAATDPDLQAAFAFIESLGTYAGEPLTAEEVLLRQHFPRRVWHYLDSRLGVEHGTTLDRLAMRGFANYERGWEARETNYTLASPYVGLFDPTLARLGDRLRLNTPVAAIDWHEKPTARLLDGTLIPAERILITASVRVLREGGIGFSPDLPGEKTRAFSQVGMDDGMKIILRFDERFWDERMYFLHTDGFLPQFWVSGKGKSEESLVLTAFIGGSRAERLMQLGVDPVRFAVGELDGVFGNSLASRLFVEGFIADWGRDPWVRGLYSYPTLATTPAVREALAATVGERLFFAGEATDTEGHSGTVHGAMASGERAARQMLR